ncbi:MAG: TolC family protein [Gammaproteobacteria bacterium]|nr:TolC family protein [Gammaproteobacteria bacterium]
MNALIKLSFISLLFINSTLQADNTVSLKQALELALSNDALISGLVAKQDSWNQLSHASQTWDDPKLRFGAQAVPIDTFNLDQEPMTQLVLGYQQNFPRGNSLKNKTELMKANASTQASKLESRKRQVILAVKKSWYEVWYRENAISVIESNRKVFEEMLNINEEFYASGRANQQSVVQAELDISLIDDKLQTMQSELFVAQEELAKWLGVNDVKVVHGAIDENEYTLMSLPALQSLIKQHPQLKQAQDNLDIQRSALALEEDKYSAQWGLDVRYGNRQGERVDGSDLPDFMTAMVTLDLPVFTEEKQDRHVASGKSKVQSARYKLIDTQREILKKLKQTHARLFKFKQRLKLYSEKINSQAKQNTEVAMRGYRSGVVDFLTLSKAQVTEFNTRLAELKLKYQFSLSKSDLEFLVGNQ